MIELYTKKKDVGEARGGRLTYEVTRTKPCSLGLL